ncbi:MAG: hypothetical protein KDN18_02510 [Verrucomicrobiae bacterium]|nr:hypothetical protein [Verrucomicrobiae bacterium]
MTPRSVLIASAFLALLTLTGRSEAEDKVHVSAYYYPWYHSDGRHWREGYAGMGGDEAPALGEYSSRDPETLARHLSWSEQYGIDNWICSWWGPDSWEDTTLRLRVLPTLEKNENRTTFAILYEAAGLLGLDPESGIVFDEDRTELFVSHFRHLAECYLTHPSCQQLGGRPVVYLYLSRTFSGDYARAIARARAVVEARGLKLFLVGDEVYWGKPDPARISLFDAITAYNMHGPLPYAGAEDWNRFLEDCSAVYQTYRDAATTTGTAFIPGVMPGFDTRGNHYSIPRSIRPGARPNSTLESFLRIAREHLDPGLRTIAVTSFNEWHEGTALEPSRRGDNGGKLLGEWARGR